ncbi:hypothetical protein GCM10010156_21140 [Planobispora rosea]|uniref:DUF2795 domain-containing protein n=1 Tax=Planobispora rosea TaxID=35762 RepID=A0A8J3S6H8_PLARO|nr:DUF2795 domain-containing protein [Planobispora rosea]GGS62124.1 hypothetical protein GCM10010156_21140 [Planobispora rosea]GIH84373.1 hypothetical protein Pro02_27810 [Planobispora rosea]
MTRTTDPGLVRQALLSLDYPADKQEVIQQATNAGAEAAVLRVLAALPLGTYDNLDEILRSIPRSPDEGEDITPGERDTKVTADAIGSRGRITEHLREPR